MDTIPVDVILKRLGQHMQSLGRRKSKACSTQAESSLALKRIESLNQFTKYVRNYGTLRRHKSRIFDLVQEI